MTDRFSRSLVEVLSLGMSGTSSQTTVAGLCLDMAAQRSALSPVYMAILVCVKTGNG
jgi:hypothetical protein